MSQILKLTLSFQSNCFPTQPKSQDKKLNILRTKRAFEMKQKAFFIIFKGLSFTKNYLRSESVPLKGYICPQKIFDGRKPSSKLTLKTKWCHRCGCCHNSRSCEQLKKGVKDKHFDLNPNHLPLKEKCYH